MLPQLLVPEIRELIEAGDEVTLREAMDRWLPADVAELFGELSEHEDRSAFHVLQGPQRTKVFEYLARDLQRRILFGLPEPEARQLLTDMAADDRTALLEEIEPADRERFLQLLGDEERVIAQALLLYPEDSVGRLMTPDYVAVREHWTIQHVLDYIRGHGRDRETLNVVYVVDDQHKLIDDLRIRQVLLARPLQEIRDLMDHNFIALKATDPKRTTVEVFRHYDRTALPVVDDCGKLLGIVTIDDVIDIAEQAATEDIQKFGGLEALSEPYATTSLVTMVHKRATWLVLLFVGELFTATAMGFFEKEIQRAVVLALFIPLIISSGGNSGSQAATLIVRALAVGEISLRDWRRTLFREIASGLMLGGILGSIGFLRIALWSAFSDVYGPHWLLVALTVAFSLVGIVMWGALSGAMLPFVLKWFGLDPATSSAPFVATLVDVTGLVIYFSIATMVLGGTLL